jgi:hypothetical protein
VFFSGQGDSPSSFHFHHQAHDPLPPGIPGLHWITWSARLSASGGILMDGRGPLYRFGIDTP